ncbi:hypothetical protein HK101_010167 [Irineochytrium annulatum]|nr:hypothetical protein HK101_010167 [Irineochytrium annulatum]
MSSFDYIDPLMFSLPMYPLEGQFPINDASALNQPMMPLPDLVDDLDFNIALALALEPSAFSSTLTSAMNSLDTLSGNAISHTFLAPENSFNPAPPTPPHVELDLDFLMSLDQDTMFDPIPTPASTFPLALRTAPDTPPLDSDALMATMLSNLDACSSLTTSPSFSLASVAPTSPAFSTISTSTPPATPSAHTGEPRPKNFECSVCFHRFFRKHDMLRHARSHAAAASDATAAARPNACAGCGRSYARPDGLRRHLRCEESCFEAMVALGRGGRRGKRLMAAKRAMMGALGGDNKKAENPVDSEISRASVALMESLVAMDSQPTPQDHSEISPDLKEPRMHGLCPAQSLLGRSTFDPATSLPDLTGRTAVVTGATSGLGLESAIALSRAGARVIMGCRTPEKGLTAVAAVRAAVAKAREAGKKEKAAIAGEVESLVVEMGSLESVRLFAAEVLRRLGGEKAHGLHVLMNNAGAVAPAFETTVDGVERQFAQNYMGHFYLTSLLLPLLEETSKSTPVTVVNVSSMVHAFAMKGIDFDNINNPATYTSSKAYAQSKLAQILFGAELQRRLDSGPAPSNIYVNSLHPGAVNSNFYRPECVGSFCNIIRPIASTFFYTPAQGCHAQLYAAVSPEIVEKQYRGRYFMPQVTVAEPSAMARDEDLARRLWEWTEELIREKGF